MTHTMKTNPLKGRLGRFIKTPVAGDIVQAFVPPSLPPIRQSTCSA